MAVARLQKRIIVILLAVVIVPMLVAGGFATVWVSSSFEARIQQWLAEAVRSGQQWLEANQNDATLLGRILADDPAFVTSLTRDPRHPRIAANILQIADELGITVLRVYSADQHLLYSRDNLVMDASWEPDQSDAVLHISGSDHGRLAAVGIVPVPSTAPRYYLVLGGLLDEGFITDLSHLSGLETRLYYRERDNFFDIFSGGGPHRLRLPAGAKLSELVDHQRPLYSRRAEDGRYRGFYLPIADSQGHVEAVLFGGIQRRGSQELLGNGAAMFAAILALGGAIGALSGWFLSRFLIRPVEQLRHGVLQVAANNYEVALQPQGDDELGDLAQAFNAMAASIRQARDEERQRFTNDKLAAMGELSAALAHEIRNPVGVINAAAAMLQRGPDAARSAQLLTMIRDESSRIDELVGEFLQLSRHRQPQPRPIAAALPLRQALEAMLAGQTQVKVIDDERAAATICADVGLLRQAWGNIIRNAVEVMGSAGGTLTVGVRQAAGQVTVTLEDSGGGISPDVLPRLFEPFFTTKERGTGLGLSIAHSLVQANGGHLEALPPQGRGACFGMTFPLDTENA